MATRQPTWDASPLPGGGWRITVPGRPMSSNWSLKEHRKARMARRNGYTLALKYLRLQHGLRSVPVFERATLHMACYFPRGTRAEPHNYGPGAGGKVLVDALLLGTDAQPRSGWLRDDGPRFLLVQGEPEIAQGELRTEITLLPWSD